jgi:hypothetical protein
VRVKIRREKEKGRGRRGIKSRGIALKGRESC